MSEVSRAPDLSALQVPIDSWTQPFWDGTAAGKILLPRCADCRRFRWPPGPFCPACQSQRTEWLPAGTGRIYSFTITRNRREADPSPVVPALIEFPEAGGVRFLAAIVDTSLDKIHIGAEVSPGWSQAANARVPIFKIQTS